MSQVLLEEAAAQFNKLVDQARNGEEVVIVHDNVPIAKLVSATAEEPKALRPGFGSGKDDILYMADDFDAPMEDFKDYM